MNKASASAIYARWSIPQRAAARGHVGSTQHCGIGYSGNDAPCSCDMLLPFLFLFIGVPYYIQGEIKTKKLETQKF